MQFVKLKKWQAVAIALFGPRPEMTVSITKYAHVFANKRYLFNLKTYYSVIYKYSYCFQTLK